MKNSILALLMLLIFTVTFSCNKQDEQAIGYEDTGFIQGLDMAQCACCGNWILDIKGDINKRQFLELPADSGIDLSNANFPIAVQFNWESVNGPCSEHVIITEIEPL